LLAVAQFLQSDIKPAIKDPALAFRVLIAANLATTIATELWAEDSLFQGVLDRLRALLPDVHLGDLDLHRADARREALARLNGALARRIRENALDPESRKRAFDAVKANLRDALAVTNPRFDTSANLD
jgi:hypothetical protein